MFLGEDLRQAFAAAERSWELQGVYLGPLSLEARPVRIRIHHLHLVRFMEAARLGTSCFWTRRPSRPSTSGAHVDEIGARNKVEQQFDDV